MSQTFTSQPRPWRQTLNRYGGPLAVACGLLLAAPVWWTQWPAPGPGSAAAASGAPVLLVQGDLRGEVKPCGCSPEGQLGGLPRRLTFLTAAFADPGTEPILLDVGNNFPPPSDQGRLKIELIQSMLRAYRPAAILPGPNELANGLSLLAPDLPYMASNDAVNAVFAPHATVERDGAAVGIYGYLSPELVYQEFSPHYRLEPAGDGLLARWREARATAGHELMVLLFRGSDAELAWAVGSGLFDRIVVGNRFDDELNQEIRREAAGAVLPQVPTKGQGIYRLSLTAGGAGDAAPALPEPVWLTGVYGDHPVAVQGMAVYDEQVKGLFFSRLETMERHGADSPFIGAANCVACHPAAAEAWRASRHADALAALSEVGKQFDPECLSCHVVGLEQGGFLSAELTPQLANVQCENCHGPGRAHAGDPANVLPAKVRETVAAHGSPAAICRDCHHGSHSPSFDYAAYWPRIAHGAAPGEPAAKMAPPATERSATARSAGPAGAAPPSPTSDLRPVPASAQSASGRGR